LRADRVNLAGCWGGTISVLNPPVREVADHVQPQRRHDTP
jgi:hypothetical protein